MKAASISGWFDNQKTQRRELWCLGELHRSWPRTTIDSCSDFAPWGAYPNLPCGLADLTIGSYVNQAMVKGAVHL